MSAGYKIKWSARAADDFEQIICYLSGNWNEREIRKICPPDRQKHQLHPNFSAYLSGYLPPSRTKTMCHIKNPYFVLPCTKQNYLSYYDLGQPPGCPETERFS